MHVTFSINEYDHDGDISESGFYLHFGETRIKVANHLTELDSLVENIIRCKDEIHENCISMGIDQPQIY